MRRRFGGCSYGPYERNSWTCAVQRLAKNNLDALPDTRWKPKLPTQRGILWKKMSTDEYTDEAEIMLFEALFHESPQGDEKNNELRRI